MGFSIGGAICSRILGSPYTVQKTFGFEIEYLNRLSQLLMTDDLDKGIFAVINS